MLDTVAQPLIKVIDKLEQANLPYTVTVTKPARATFPLQDDLFVIRQQLDEVGIYKLTVAAKMGKEVF